MAIAYGPQGLMGVLTPQANTTVEPEMVAMTPPGFAFVNARLKSDKATIPERLADYFDNYEASVGEFANAPLKSVGFACTGASYLGGAALEDALLERLEESRGIVAVTAASAVIDALRVLGAKRVALVSPYNDALDDVSAAYWQSRGLEVVARRTAFRPTDDFHPIYTLEADAARPGIEAVADVPADAIVLLGTGMPTLPPIAEAPTVAGKPLLSCMLCLGWRLVTGAAGRPADRASLEAFLHDPGWRARLAAMMG